MVKTTLILLAVLAVAAVICPAVCAEDGEPQGKLVAPPAIYIPAGGKVVTEVNLRDEDVLGMIKQVIPAAAEVAKGIMGGMAQHSEAPGMGMGAMPLMIASQLDVNGLIEAVDGVKAVRVLIVKYGKSTDPDEIIKQFDVGAAKAGVFSKMLWDTGFFPGAVAVYAAPDNGGFMGLAYNASDHTLYAARIVGFVDVAKLTKWAADAATMIGIGKRVAVEESAEMTTPPSTATPELCEPVMEDAVGGS